MKEPWASTSNVETAISKSALKRMAALGQLGGTTSSTALTGFPTSNLMYTTSSTTPATYFSAADVSSR